jgi:hypothetical protein
MAAKLKIEKGDEINKKSSPLKLESQSQHPRIIPQKFGCNWPGGF